MADEGAYHPHEDFTLFRQDENQRDFHKRGYRMAELDACLSGLKEKAILTDLSENAAQSVVRYL